MKSISIYTITRNQNIEQLQKLERQLSGRDYFLKMREWELESMKAAFLIYSAFIFLHGL